MTSRENIINSLTWFLARCKKEFVGIDKMAELKDQIIAELGDAQYPIGSIYMSANNTNPTVYFGGEWVAWGSGRVPVGVDVNDTAFSEVEAIGGEKVHTLTSSEIPSHAHSISEKSYTSGINSVNHTHGIGAHSHGLNNHTHVTNSFGVVSATASANHTHNFSVNTNDTSKTLTGTFKALQWQTGTASGIVSQATNKTDRAAGAGTQMGHNTFTIDASHHHLVSGTTEGISATHNHFVTIPATMSNGPSTATTANSAQFNSGNQSANHTHNVTISAHNTNSTGSGNAHNNLQPYITCYMWKRVA